MGTENKTRINRRDFGKGLVAGSAVGAIGMMGAYSYSPWRKQHFHKDLSKNIDIGECRSVKITNISETSWFSNDVLMEDIKGAGGLLVNQYTFNWPPFTEKRGVLGKGSYEKGIKEIKQWLPQDLEKAWEFQMENSIHPKNPGGFACLIDVELLDGSHKRILLDSGWSYDWMDKSFQREGIDKMLANHEIDYFFISHEHFDHFWGLPVTYKYDPTIATYIPEGFYPEGLQYIEDCGFKGELTVVKNGLYKMFPGCASFTFPVPIITRVYGEQSLFFNVKDLGLCLVSGCCHQGIVRMADTAIRNLKYDNLHGIYGGLHISPFEDWDPKYDDLVIALKKYGFEKVGCNHCTGIVTARKFIEMGYPVVQGTARHRSKDKAYLGNGDTIEFKA